MYKPLAIVAPQIGLRSETFIGRHMQDLLPDGTVVVAAAVNKRDAQDWTVNCPVLEMDWISQSGVIGWRPQLRACMTQNINHIFGRRSTEPDWGDVKQFLREHKVQSIMAEYLDLCFPWLEVAQQLDIPFFGHAHGYDISSCLQQAKWRKKYLRYNETGGIITVSKVSRERLLDLGLQSNKVHVVPCGIRIPASPLQRTERETIQCLAVGRMVAKKAPLKTLEAFRKAAEVCPSLRLDYVGAGELLPAAQEFIRTFNLGNKVTLQGGQPNEVVQQLMKKADIFLQHSITDPESGNEEGLPVAILEAMANSLPVISTRHAGIPEAVLDGFTGYLVDEGDTAAMGDHIVMLALDSGLRQRMGEDGWRRVKDNFSWENEQRELLKILGLNQPIS